MYKPPKYPVSGPKPVSKWWWALFGFLALAAVSNFQDQSGDEAASKKQDDEACFRDASCIGNKKVATAGELCAREVEALAKYSHEWTDGTFEKKFSHFLWKDQAGGWMTFLGDKVKFQNGFGAWQNMVYSCELNVRTDNVGAVSARPGRL
ncbi:MAG: hypothetical protein LDL26_12555 [Caenispirillum bisanense]|nr:hypothetical protein [Caenispirillum bisanense]